MSLNKKCLSSNYFFKNWSNNIMVCYENQGVMTESHAVLGISTIPKGTARCFFYFCLPKSPHSNAVLDYR